MGKFPRNARFIWLGLSAGAGLAPSFVGADVTIPCEVRARVVQVLRTERVPPGSVRYFLKVDLEEGLKCVGGDQRRSIDMTLPKGDSRAPAKGRTLWFHYLRTEGLTPEGTETSEDWAPQADEDDYLEDPKMERAMELLRRNAGKGLGPK